MRCLGLGITPKIVLLLLESMNFKLKMQEAEFVGSKKKHISLSDMCFRICCRNTNCLWLLYSVDVYIVRVCKVFKFSKFNLSLLLNGVDTQKCLIWHESIGLSIKLERKQDQQLMFFFFLFNTLTYL